jgi:nucleoid-associated protein YgaU
MGLEKAEITNTFTDERFKVLFNPGEYTINKDNNFAQVAVPGLRSPLLQFVHGNMRTLEMELFFDTYDTPKLPKRDVREETNKIVRLLDIDPERHAPPVLLFVWGDLRFTCVLARASQRFTMFAEDGRPVRARLTVTFNEFTNADREAKEIKRSTADFTKLHIVAQGETLSSIAEQLYRNPALWRPIAIVNEVDNPRKLPVGLRLRVPPLPFRDPQSGEVFE